MKGNVPVRVITRAADGNLRIRDYATAFPLVKLHTQIGVDDCSTDVRVRGLPVFRELVGPVFGKDVAQYESPEVFEMLTSDWVESQSHHHRRIRKRLEMRNR